MERLCLALLCVLLCSCAPGPAAQAPADPARRHGDAYYLSTCALCDRPLGYIGPAVAQVIEGRELRFCGDECVGRFQADPAAGWAHIDAVMTKDQVPHYPPGPSVVSGRGLGSDPTDLVWGNRLVRLASKGERATFLKDPERYIEALDERVILAQTPTYGMPNRCPVQGDILSDDVPIDFVIANRMVRVCCVRCMRIVRARPYQYLALVDYANREAATHADP